MSFCADFGMFRGLESEYPKNVKNYGNCDGGWFLKWNKEVFVFDDFEDKVAMFKGKRTFGGYTIESREPLQIFSSEEEMIAHFASIVA